MSVASSNVNEPLFVSTTTECVLPSSRSASSAFDSSPPISQSIDVFPPPELSLSLLPPHPTRRSPSTRRIAMRIRRHFPARGGREPSRSRPCTPFREAALLSRAHLVSRGPTGWGRRLRG